MQVPWDFRLKKQEFKFMKVIGYKEGINHQKGARYVHKKWSKTPFEQNPETIFKIENFDFFGKLSFRGAQVRRSVGVHF